MTIFPDTTIHQQPAQSTEEVRTAYPDITMIISGWFKEFNSTLTKTKIQTRAISRYLRRLLVQSWEYCCQKRKSKVFQNPSQSTAEFWKLWRGFCKLSKNHWGQVIRKQSLYSRRKANHSHSHNTTMQGSKPTSQHHCNGQDAELEGCSSASLQYQDARVEARVSASLQWPRCELEARVSAIYAIPRCRARSPRLVGFEARVYQVRSRHPTTL